MSRLEWVSLLAFSKEDPDQTFRTPSPSNSQRRSRPMWMAKRHEITITRSSTGVLRPDIQIRVKAYASLKFGEYLVRPCMVHSWQSEGLEKLAST